MKSLTPFSKKTLILMAGYVLLKWSIIFGAGSYLYSHGVWKNEFFLVLPVLGIIVFGIRHLKKTKRCDGPKDH